MDFLGNLYLAYTDDGADGGDIYFTKSTDSGRTWIPPVRVDDDPTNRLQANASIAIEPTGEAIYVAWEDYRLHGNDSEIRVSKSLDGGLTWGDGLRNNNDPIVSANLDVGIPQIDPEVVSPGAGLVYVVWNDYRRSKWDVFFAASNDYGQTWGPNVIVNDNINNSPQLQPTIAVNETGSIFVAWQDNRKPGRASDIFFSRSDDSGATWLPNVLVNDDPGSNGVVQDRPDVAATGSAVYVLWHDERAGDAVYSSRSLDAGLTWGDGVANDNDVRASDGAGPTPWPVLGVAGATIYAAWEDGRRGNPDVFASRSPDGAQTWGDGFLNGNDPRVNDDPSWSLANQSRPALAASGARACVAWEDDREANWDILLACWGGAAWGDGRVNDRDLVAAGFGTPVPGDQRRPQMVSKGSELFAVWEDNRTGDWGIRFAASQDGGTSWGDGLRNNNDYRVDDAPSGAQDRPSLAVTLGGTIGVAWRDARRGQTDIYFASTADGGDTWGNGEVDDTDARINDDAGTAAQDWPALAALPNGTFVAVWEDYRGGNADLYLAYSLDGGLTWSANLRVDDDPRTAAQTRPAVMADTSGRIHVAYADDRGGDPDIRYTACILDGASATCGDGVPDNDALVSDDTTGANQTAPAIAFAGDRFVIAWEDDRNGTAEIRASASPNGTAWGDGLPDTDPVASVNASGPVEAADLGGDFRGMYVAWGSAAGDIFEASSADAVYWANESEPNDPANASAAQARPRVAVNSTTLFAMWDDDRGGDRDIYFASAARAPPIVPPQLLLILLDPPGPLTLVPAQVASFSALGYNTDGSQNYTWSPNWTTSDARGTVGNLSGDPAAGYLANYTAGPLEGEDNVTVRDTVATNVTATAPISIVNVTLPLDRIVLTPAAAVLAAGTALIFTALGYDAAGFLNTTWTPTWSAPALGTLSNLTGNATAGFNATYTAGTFAGPDGLTVSNGSVSATATITIQPAPLAQILLVPWPGPIATTPLGYLSFTALGYDAFGNKNITWGPPTWSAGNGTVPITGGNAISGFLGTYQAPTLVGDDTITVAYGGVTNASAIRIGPGPIAAIALTPSPGPVILSPSTVQPFRALGYDAWGNQNLTWSPNWTVGPLGSLGSLGGDAATGWTADFLSGAVAGMSWVNVSAAWAPPVWNLTTIDIVPGGLARIELTPWPDATVVVNSTLSFRALGYDAAGNKNLSWTPTWVSGPRGFVAPAGGNASAGFLATYAAGTIASSDFVQVSAAGVNNATTLSLIAGDLARIAIEPWPGPTVLTPGREQSYTALGFDGFGNLNLTWTANWSTTDGLGILVATGGSAPSGFTATYQAGPMEGLDNLTVAGAGVENRSLLEVVVPPGTDPLFRIELTPWPGPVGIPVGGSVAFRAVGYDRSGAQNLTWTPSWLVGPLGSVASSGGSAATGWTMAYRAGTAAGQEVVRVVAGGVQNATLVVIAPGPLFRIELTPPPVAHVHLEKSLTLRARAFDVFGNVNLTWTPTWTANGGHGTLGGYGGSAFGGYTAAFTAGTTLGVDTVRVAYGAISNATVIEILPGDAAVVTIDPWPGPVILNFGTTQAYVAKAYDRFGNLNTTWTPVWRVTDARGTVAAAGGNATAGFRAIYTAGSSEGMDNVTVLAGAVTNESALFLLETGALTVVELQPPPITIRIGERLDLTARGYDDQGRPNSTWNATWVLVSGSAVGTLGAFAEPWEGYYTAVFTGNALGTATVRATSDTGLANTTTIRVADVDPPVTQVRALPPYTTEPAVEVAVDFEDSGGSGFAYFELFRRRNGGPWEKVGEFTSSPLQTTLPSEGRYDWFSRGVDNAGNREDSPDGPDATILYDTTPPSVVSVEPSGGTVSPADFRVVVEFSENVVPGSVRITVSDGVNTWTEADGTLVVVGGRAVFVADLDAQPGSTLTVTVTGARDAAGNTMDRHRWTLRTPGGQTSAVNDWWWILLVLAVAGFLLFFFLWKRRRKKEEEKPKKPGKKPPPPPPPPPKAPPREEFSREADVH